MGLYEQIKEIAKSKGYSINKLEQELGFARSSINKFNKNKPSIDKLQQIAEFLNVSVNDLTDVGDVGLVTCKECGLMYDSSSKEDIEEHNKQHEAWEKATQKFGKLYCYSPERERIKAECRNISHNVSLPLKKRVDAQLQVLRCLFSRSGESSGYDLKHMPFDVYVSTMLQNDFYKSSIDKDVFQELQQKYEIKSNGFTAPIAAHAETNIFTPEELKKIEDYKRLLLAARPKGE